ncbi:MAG: Ig-like domain-containing protein [Bacteroidetes bacterium]|nr:Ig-like domain-containing protein [Bacteroidota bacterium]
MHTLLVTLLSLTFFQQVATDTDSSRVVVYPATTKIEVNNSTRLTIVKEVYNVGGKDLSRARIRWFSSDSDVATVDSTGKVSAQSPGEVRIVAVVDGQPGFAMVTVPQLPPALIRLTAETTEIFKGTGAPVAAVVKNRLGQVLPDEAVGFTTSNPDIASVDRNGRVTGYREGNVRIQGTAGTVASTIDLRVVPNPAASYEVVGLTSVKTGDVLRLRVKGLSIDGQEVYGFTPSWSVDSYGGWMETDGEEGVFVAEQPGSYTITAVVGPQNVLLHHVEVSARHYTQELVKVGRGGIANHHSGDTWVFEGVDGRDYAYVGTFLYDWMKVFDVTDPENPILTDSLQMDARRINDVKIHPNNRIGIATREGASNRKNGIVLLDLSSPSHPTVLSEYTETVTGGVHNTWIDGENNLVYAVNDGTRDIHIIDISNPKKPKEVGRWGLDKENKSLHDVIVQDGYAYLSYWNDGLVTLDVGAGTHGGTPTEPKFVSQIIFDTPNAHVAWRYGRYVFVGDEIFPPRWNADQPIEASGYIHIVDMSDMDNPIEVGRYEVPEAGAHNIWADDDKLYVGYYQGGLRVVDISGELRGNLYRQGREISSYKTTDHMTTTPNWPMTWGAQLFKGNIYTSDLNSGLWILKLVDRQVP